MEARKKGRNEGDDEESRKEEEESEARKDIAMKNHTAGVSGRKEDLGR